jgi:NADH-quinone oxidoreductase subunit G
MQANINVSEPKPPEDPDSSLSYTMEGYRGMPPSSMIPFFWSPGWNSVQSVNKYQQEIGGALKGGDPGIRLLEPSITKAEKYFEGIPEAFKPLEDHLLIMPMHHIFGSEELSARSPSVAQRIPQPYILLSMDDAVAMSLLENYILTFYIGRYEYSLPVKVSNAIPNGVAAVPYGIHGIPYTELPEWATTRAPKYLHTLTPTYTPKHLNT